MKYQKLINTNIKELRIKHGLTQEEFAEKIGLSVQGLSNLERNRYQPTSDTIDKICKNFNLAPVELLLTNSQSDECLITNINSILRNCSKHKLKQIYDIIRILQ